MKQNIDLTGQKIGRLTVLHEAPKRNQYRYWTCKCDCGNIKEIAQSTLRTGKTISCGCYRIEKLQKKKLVQPIDENLINHKFGKLTVIKYTTERNHNKVIWLCKCDCGNYCKVRGDRLKNGTTKSCGCLKEEIAMSNPYK